MIRALFLKEGRPILETEDNLDINFRGIIVKIFNRQKYSGGEPKTIENPLEFIFTELARNLLKENNDKKKAKILLRKILEGNSESIYLKGLLRSFIPQEEFAQTQFLYSHGGIFILLSKDKVIWDIEKYEDRESSYKNNYQRYVAFRIKKLTQCDPPTDDLRQILVHSIINEE
ncbi:MAG TPA: hypothetical protein VHD35_11245 [Chitinophagaceae bacterium]|nr:hypothetical protein [Chitinophagaceae bacterium]